MISTRTFTRRLCRATLLAMALLIASACAAIDPDIYRDQQPEFRLAQYFDGRVEAAGMFQDRSGKVIRRFTVTIDGKFAGAAGELLEQFSFDDGSKQTRVWTLKKLDDGRWQGSADDVVGLAQGVARGNALNWRYRLRLPVADTHYEVSFDDWMILIDDKRMLNRALVSKWGIRVGEVFISFNKQ